MSGVLPADEVARIRRDFIGEMGPYGAIRQLAVSHEALRSRLAAAHDVIRLLLTGAEHATGQHYYELEMPDEPQRWVEVDAVTKAWKVLRPVTPAERDVILAAVLGAADATPTEAPK